MLTSVKEDTFGLIQGGPNKVLETVFFKTTADIDLNFYFTINGLII